MKIAVIHYNAGNIRSLSFALERLGIEPILTNDPEVISSADKVIFPGVGEASSTMKHLTQLGLERVIPNLLQPVLGICLGMQLLCHFSKEGNTKCMGVFDVEIEKIPIAPGIKVPHVGWNQLEHTNDWMTPVPVGSYAYFVHSYYAPVNPYTTATSNYGISISAAMRKDNFYAVQFHPEKSSDTGRIILESFLNN